LILQEKDILMDYAFYQIICFVAITIRLSV